MIRAYKTSNFFIIAALWLNSVKASEYRPFPVPSYHSIHNKSFSLSSMMSHISLPNMPSIPSPNFGKLFTHIDLSGGAKLVQEHKVMLSIATSVIFLSFLAKQLQKSDMWKKSWQQKCVDTENAVNEYTQRCIKQCPLSVQFAITAIAPLKLVIQFLCSVIKEYVAMNHKTIVFSVASPVTGRLLDTVVGCPIPFLNFTSIGGMISGVVITKGYFDSSFAEMKEQLNGIDTKIDNNQSKIVDEINDVKKEVGMVRGLLEFLGKQSNAGIQLIKAYGEKLSNIASQVSRLENIGQQNSQQLETIEYQVLSLRQELGLMKKELEQSNANNTMLLENNKALREDLMGMRAHSDTRFDTLEEKIERGFDRMGNKLDNNPTIVPVLMSIEHKLDNSVPFIASPDRLMLAQNRFSRIEIGKENLSLLLDKS